MIADLLSRPYVGIMPIELVVLLYITVDSVRTFSHTEGTFEVIYNTRIKTEYVLEASNAKSSSHCTYKCLRGSACRGVSYHSLTSQCEHWSDGEKNITQITEFDTAWESWSLLSTPVDCLDIKVRFPIYSSDVFYIRVNEGWIPVFCDLDYDAGGWTVFQHRFNGTTSFYRGIEDYIGGFGDIQEEFWLGLELLHLLTINSTNTLYVGFTDFDDNTVYELYEDFKVGEGPGYMLLLGELLSHNTTNTTTSDASSMTQICQFVSEVIGFSSEYGGSWSADQVIGEPDVYPRYGDISGAWTPSSVGNGYEHLQLRYNRSIEIINITVYETYNSGAVKTISVLTSSDTWTTIWSTSTVTRITSSRAFSPSIQPIQDAVSDVRIEFDTSMASSYYEVDAIQVCGQTNTVDPNTFQYSHGAQFSTLDRDVDDSTSHCADLHRAGWWFKDCTGINPNGDYSTDGRVSVYNSGYGGVIVPGWKGVQPIKTTRLMFRRKHSLNL